MSREDKKNMTPEERKKERTLFYRQTLIPIIIIIVNFSLAMGILYISRVWSQKNQMENSLFNEGRIPVQNDDGKWYVMNQNGKLMSEGYSVVNPYRYGAAAVRNDENKWGFIGSDGELIIDCVYDEVSYFSKNGVAAVRMGNEWYYIDKRGEKKYDKTFISAGDFLTNRVARVVTDKGVGLLVTDGTYALEPGQYADVGNISIENGYAAVKDHNEKWGYVNSNGELVVECKYAAAFSYVEGNAMVKNEEGLFGFVNKDGDEIVPCQYVTARNFSIAQYAAVYDTNGKWGYVNSAGKLKIPCKFTDCLDFTNDESAAVCDENGKWGYINNRGEYIIEIKYIKALPIANNDMAAVRKDNEKWIYIDRKGKQVIAEEYDYADTFADNSIAVVGKIINEKMNYAVIDEKGEVLVNYGKYANLEIYESGEILGTSEDGKYTFIGIDGTVISEDIENFKPAGGVIEKK